LLPFSELILLSNSCLLVQWLYRSRQYSRWYKARKSYNRQIKWSIKDDIVTSSQRSNT
jgi:hypothetical protein